MPRNSPGGSTRRRASSVTSRQGDTLFKNEMSHPAFDPQLQCITALWPVLISRATVSRRLSWPGWLVTYRGGMPARRRSTIQVPTGNRPIVRRPGIELSITESQVRRPITTRLPSCGQSLEYCNSLLPENYISIEIIHSC